MQRLGGKVYAHPKTEVEPAVYRGGDIFRFVVL